MNTSARETVLARPCASGPGRQRRGGWRQGTEQGVPGPHSPRILRSSSPKPSRCSRTSRAAPLCPELRAACKGDTHPAPWLRGQPETRHPFPPLLPCGRRAGCGLVPGGGVPMATGTEGSAIPARTAPGLRERGVGRRGTRRTRQRPARARLSAAQAWRQPGSGAAPRRRFMVAAIASPPARAALLPLCRPLASVRSRTRHWRAG